MINMSGFSFIPGAIAGAPIGIFVGLAVEKSNLFKAIAVYLIFIFFHPRGKIRVFFSHYPYLSGGFYGGLIASLLTMLVNDSGVVASATILFYPLFSFLYLLPDLINNSD